MALRLGHEYLGDPFAFDRLDHHDQVTLVAYDRIRREAARRPRGR